MYTSTNKLCKSASIIIYLYSKDYKAPLENTWEMLATERWCDKNGKESDVAQKVSPLI